MFAVVGGTGVEDACGGELATLLAVALSTAKQVGFVGGCPLQGFTIGSRPL